MKAKNPWKKLGSTVKYENPWIRVREDQVLTPGGKPGIYGVVETHPAVGVLALNSQNDIYLVGQYRYPINEYSWEIVEGAAHAGEPLEAAALRELQEETGLQARTLVRLGSEISLSNCFTDERAHLFLATDLTEGPPSPEECEDLQVRKLPLAEAVQMVRTGELKDAMSVIGILLLQQWPRTLGN